MKVIGAGISRTGTMTMQAALHPVGVSLSQYHDVRGSFAPLHAGRPARLPGAFRVRCSWSMTNPLDSQRIRRSAMAESWLRRTY